MALITVALLYMCPILVASLFPNPSNWTSSLESGFISRLLGPVWTPRWLPVLCVSCVDQSAYLIWSLWCSSVPILCRCLKPLLQTPHWAPRGLYLNPADSNKQTEHCSLLPSRWTAVKTKKPPLVPLWRWNSVLKSQSVSLPRRHEKNKTGHINTTLQRWPQQLLHVCVSKALRTCWRFSTHLFWLSLTFTLTLGPLGVVGPESLSLKSY